MSQRIRGQEVTLRFLIDGERQEGSWFKVTEFEVTPRTDINEEDFIGEQSSDLDIQHHGFDFSFGLQIQDQRVMNFLTDIVDREANHEQHPVITMTVQTVFRTPGSIDQVETYRDVFLKLGASGFSGRKEYVTASFEGKAKRRTQFSAL